MKTNNTNDDDNIKQKVITSLSSNDLLSFEENFRAYLKTVTLKDVSPFMMKELRPYIESNPKIIKIIEKCLIDKENEHEELSTMSSISSITTSSKIPYRKCTGSMMKCSQSAERWQVKANEEKRDRRTCREGTGKTLPRCFMYSRLRKAI